MYLKSIIVIHQSHSCVYLDGAVNVTGEDVVRPYTPVTSLAGISIPPAGCVRLLVKGYPSGTLSSWLTSQPVGTRLHLSLPLGSFNVQPLATITHLMLLAAGTGFTPMIPLITWALRSTRSKVQLIFFNKSEKDIIWQEQLNKLMADNARFSVEHILSEPSSQWSGKTGHINLSLLQSYLPVSSVDIPNTYYVCVCGPTSFTQLTERCLKEDLGYTTNNYYCFLGQ
ncbi:Cytochrome b5 reductase 4 [Homalodisca vitripennis]|nr:Cytochrome b5 reductase 4 [Homalodisca vitripennis]